MVTTLNVYYRLVVSILLVAVVFLCTANRIVGFPLDKLMMVLVFTFTLLIYNRSPLLKVKELILVLSIFLIATISSAANATFNPMIFFPSIGMLFAIVFSKFDRSVTSILYYSIFIHTIFAIVFVISAYLIGPGPYVWSLSDKGLPFVFSTRGFTPTVQAFGTMCMAWLLIYIFRKEENRVTRTDKIMFAINIIAVLLTLNRSTYLFWIVILFLKIKKLFTMVVIGILSILLWFWKEVLSFLTNKGSIVARSELLEGFNLSFWDSNSIITYIFGKGNNELAPDIIAKVKWDHRSDIENGYAMLLHTFGFVGLLFYIVICLLFIWKFIRIKSYSEALILTYFLFVSPYITQEFVSTTFYLFLSVMIYRYYQQLTKNNGKAVQPITY